MNIHTSTWMTIKAIGDRQVQIDIDGYIGHDPIESYLNPDYKQNTKERVKAELKSIGELDVDHIVVNIDSLGGDLGHALSIHDLLAFNKAKVTTNVSGRTASAGTVIAQAGDNRTISANALYLVHRSSGVAIGNVDAMKAMVNDLEKHDQVMMNVYKKRGGVDGERLEELMKQGDGQGRWMGAEEVIENGFADTLIEPTPIQAISPEILARYNLPKIESMNINETIESLKASIEEIKAKLTSSPSKSDVESASELLIEANTNLDEASKTINELKATNGTLTKRIAEIEEESGEIEKSLEERIKELEVQVERLKAKEVNPESNNERDDQFKDFLNILKS